MKARLLTVRPYTLLTYGLDIKRAAETWSHFNHAMRMSLCKDLIMCHMCISINVPVCQAVIRNHMYNVCADVMCAYGREQHNWCVGKFYQMLHTIYKMWWVECRSYLHIVRIGDSGVILIAMFLLSSFVYMYVSFWCVWHVCACFYLFLIWTHSMNKLH